MIINNTLAVDANNERAITAVLNTYFEGSKNCFLIHGLRLKHEDRAVQIDHVLINCMLDVYVLEAVSTSVKQSDSDIDVLVDIFDDLIELPKREGYTLFPNIYSRVLVDGEAKIERLTGVEANNVMAVDHFCKCYLYDYENDRWPRSRMRNRISSETAEAIAKQLAALHEAIH